MFEKEIKFISDFCLNKVKGLGSFFTYEKLAGTDLHPAILRYISAELDYMPLLIPSVNLPEMWGMTLDLLCFLEKVLK